MTYTYDHMEEFEGVEFPDFKQYSGNLILYGAGINGALCAFALKELGIDFLCFCDSDSTKQGTQYIGFPVYSPVECNQRFPHAAILFDAYCSGTSIENLTTLGYNTILFPAPLFLQLDCDKAAEYISEQLGKGDSGYCFREAVDAFQVFEWIEEYMIRGVGYITQKQQISRAVNLDLTDRCTLRCKNCLALKPYYVDRTEMTWEQMEQVINRLVSLKWFRRFHLLGGEPFLYEHLDKVLDKLCDVPEIKNINIITNGTIIPNQKVMNSLKNKKIMVRISYYGGLSDKYEELENLCGQQGINVRVHAQRWTDIGRALDQVSDTQETQWKYDECCQRTGTFFYVLNGRATLCPFAANTHALGLYESDGEDVIHILNTDSPEELMERLRSLYWRAAPLNACRYCNGWLPYATKPVPVAKQYPKGEKPQLPRYEQ